MILWTVRRHLPVLLVALFLVAASLVAVRGELSGPTTWTPDGLFYEARSLELRGTDRDRSLARTFGGPIGAELRQRDPTRSGTPSWSAYHAQFYERRIAVPAAAAAIEPLSGDRALLDVSLAGYVAAVLALFFLLLLRFPLPIAGGVALLTAFLPALTEHSSFPQTDSWGLALEIAALACAALAIDRGRRWMIPWIVLIALLSFTRDNMWIPIFAMAYLTFRLRSKVGRELVISGILASLPVLMLFSAPTRELLATMLNDAQPNPDGSWGFIIREYPGAIVDLLQADGGFVRDGAWYSAGYLMVGVACLFLLKESSASLTSVRLLRTGAVIALGYVLVVPVFSAFRLDLALVPMAAFGLGLAAERAAAALPETVSVRLPAGLTGRNQA